ncbi:hypothetical protein RJ640_020774 [Escallonia rubra]|uniref:CRAL-TRIO domain-containing protein n=1 Tax=Escallonia rubra TaxID=112253 RepID=A0AA88RS71_9ASTE|nr:hypothetical protein RJ640_020774 [Escallonia rubra]
MLLPLAPSLHLNNKSSFTSSKSSRSKALINMAARLVGAEALKKYLKEEVFPRLGETPFSVVYLNAGVKARENFPGILAVRSIYEAIPVNVKDHLKAVYYVHPGLLARLFLATFGRFIFDGGLYSKLKYVNRLGFLWNHVCRKEVEIPEYVYEHDEELEHPRPVMYYALESDHPRLAVDSPVSMYSLRCIA